MLGPCSAQYPKQLIRSEPMGIRPLKSRVDTVIIMVNINSRTAMVLTFTIVVLLQAKCSWTSSHRSHSRKGRQAADSPLVTTLKGKVRGIVQTAPSGKQVDAFLGIPFAEPPVGKYRFRHPRPIDKWSGVFNASSRPSSCFQTVDTFFGEFAGTDVWNANTPMSENCLTLNIWVPRPRPKAAAVMVWIYGGGFYSGTITLDLYDGRILAAEENIILVAINYRVASLGFLFLNHPDAPGNAGMYDQLMALQWIKDNIESFGGNSDNITLFGESAGAVSVAFHLLSPLSRSLFSQAILQSGGPTCPWGILDHKEAITRTLHLAEAVGCPHSPKDPLSVIDCLRKVDPMSLVTNETANLGVVEFPFTPIIDGAFLDESPEISMQTKNFKKTKLLLGSDSEEGNYFIVYHLTELFRKTEDVYVSRQDFVNTVRDLNPYVSKVGQDAIIFQYTDWVDPEDSSRNRDAVDKMVGDYHFTCHVNELADRYAASGNDVYYYFFNQRSTVSHWPRWMGVLHADEINFIFGEPLNTSYGYLREEVELSRRMMRYWTNFAKTGNPSKNEDGQWSKVYWPPYTSNNKEHLILNANATAGIGRGHRARECAFWGKFLPRLLKETAHHSKDAVCPPETSVESVQRLRPDQEEPQSGLGSDSSQLLLITVLVVLVVILLLVSFFAFRYRTQLSRA
ncbi:Acetylcholinesterase [Halotydeus destructor]|nr:Acetylcholinesterase [Halotydeus destructor]